MVENPLEGFGNLFGGNVGKALSGFLPQDAPETKLFKASSELSDLQKQESELLAEIGRQAFQQNPDAWPQANKLLLIQSNIAEVQQMLDSTKQEQDQAAAQKAAEDAAATCSACGYRNSEGVKFCQECGAKLGSSADAKCISCGASLEPGTRFCGECGTNLGA